MCIRDSAWAEDRDDRSIRDSEVHIVEKGFSLKRHREVFYFQHQKSPNSPNWNRSMANIEIVVSTMSTVDRAKAWSKVPGRPSRRKIGIGRVGVAGRAMKLVAPNSPSEIANANPAPTRPARNTIGRSIRRHTREGEAPSIAAASRRRSRTERITGTAVSTTNGIATSA